jgi:type I restriction enzyme S subunit
MSFLDKLLEGVEVEWKTLGDVCILNRGRVMSKEYLAENAGDYPVYSSQTANNGEIGKITTFDYIGEFITWTTDGANAGTVFHRKGKFSITNVCGLIKIKDNNELIYGFLFYWLSIEAKKYVYSGMGNRAG